jgi:hypothetical protein
MALYFSWFYTLIDVLAFSNLGNKEASTKYVYIAISYVLVWPVKG